MKRSGVPILLALGLPWSGAAAAPTFPPSVCRVVVYDEQVELDDARLELEQAAIELASFEEIFELIDGLRKADAVDRLTFLRAKYDRDAARLAQSRAEIVVTRQATLVEQYRLVCGLDEPGKAGLDASVKDAYRRYVQADCDQQAKAIEVARTNLEFNLEWLDSVNELRRGQVATRQDVIRAELDVARERQALDDAQRREEQCRARLSELPNSSGP